MKIAICIEEPIPGGEWTWLQTVWKRGRALGHSIDRFGFVNRKILKPWLRPPDITWLSKRPDDLTDTARVLNFYDLIVTGHIGTWTGTASFWRQLLPMLNRPVVPALLGALSDECLGKWRDLYEYPIVVGRLHCRQSVVDWYETRLERRPVYCDNILWMKSPALSGAGLRQRENLVVSTSRIYFEKNVNWTFSSIPTIEATGYQAEVWGDKDGWSFPMIRQQTEKDAQDCIDRCYKGRFLTDENETDPKHLHNILHRAKYCVDLTDYKREADGNWQFTTVEAAVFGAVPIVFPKYNIDDLYIEIPRVRDKDQLPLVKETIAKAIRDNVWQKRATRVHEVVEEEFCNDKRMLSLLDWFERLLHGDVHPVERYER